jgi:hypothetical protein
MPKFPEPPTVNDLQVFGVRPDEEYRLPVGATVWRVYFQGGDHPTRWHDFRAFGPTDARFDHHLLPKRVQDRKMLYGASLGPTCIAEVFQKSRTINRTRRRPWLVAFETTREVVLLDLGGAWPTRVGASQAINTGTRKRAKRWSQRIYEAFPHIHGIYYPSSMYRSEPAIALYEHAEDALPAAPSFHKPLDDASLLIPLQNVANDVGYSIL